MSVVGEESGCGVVEGWRGYEKGGRRRGGGGEEEGCKRVGGRDERKGGGALEGEGSWGREAWEGGERRLLGKVWELEDHRECRREGGGGDAVVLAKLVDFDFFLSSFQS